MKGWNQLISINGQNIGNMVIRFLLPRPFGPIDTAMRKRFACGFRDGTVSLEMPVATCQTAPLLILPHNNPDPKIGDPIGYAEFASIEFLLELAAVQPAKPPFSTITLTGILLLHVDDDLQKPCFVGSDLAGPLTGMAGQSVAYELSIATVWSAARLTPLSFLHRGVVRLPDRVEIGQSTIDTFECDPAGMFFSLFTKERGILTKEISEYLRTIVSCLRQN